MLKSIIKNFAVRTRQQLINTAVSSGLPAEQAQEAAYSCFMYCVIKCCLEINLPGYLPEDMTSSFQIHETLKEIAPACMTELKKRISKEEWKQQIQIVGWLHQYYHAEHKRMIFADKKHKAFCEQDIPAATQFFTPEWLVKYLLQNSISYFYHLPSDQCDYLIVASKKSYLPLEEIRILDPCAGTGHILTEAFDMLMQIYLNAGYAPETAVRKILQKNLFGLELDRHACEIACFCVLLKAAFYDITILKSGIQPNFLFFQDETAGSLLSESKLPEINQLLSQQYDIVITNPPYMKASRMPDLLYQFTKKHYPDSCQDLYACFIERCLSFTRSGGYCALLTMHSWMFLSSFAKLREKILHENQICSLLHLGAYAFESSDVGSIVQSAGIIMQKKPPSRQGIYINLCPFRDTMQKEQAFLTHQADIYQISQEQFFRIPGCPLIYQASEHIFNLFSLPRLGEFANPRQGLTTSDNRRFIRDWHEVRVIDICFDAENQQQAEKSGRKWFPYHKGGGYRKWYGNHYEVINYQNGGRELTEFHEELNRTHPGGRLKNKEYYFRESVTWTFIAVNSGFRYSPPGFLFDVAGSSLFANSAQERNYLLGFLCSAAAEYLLYLLNPTMNIQVRDIKLLPYIQQDSDQIQALVKENIQLCQEDWDAFEISWNFKRHPLI